MISVLVVEDLNEHQIYFKEILSSHTEFKFLGVCATGNDAIKAIKQLKPNIVLIDIGLPDMSGVDCIKILKPICPEVKFMICTVYEEENQVFEALKAGAQSYILKKSKQYQIVDAINDLYNGDTPISSSIARKILHYLPAQFEKEGLKKNYQLTSKEVEILNCLAKGRSYQEVSDEKFISIKTLKWHVYNIYKKLHVDNRTEALNKYYGLSYK